MSASFDDMLKSVLSDPEAMEKISSLIGSVTQKEEEKTLPSTTQSGDADDFFNMETLLRAREIIGKISNEDDPRLNLLFALKPYLSKKRITKIDSAIKILKVSKFMPLIKDFNIF